MIQNIKVLATAILIGFGAISAGLASDTESDQEDSLLGSLYKSSHTAAVYSSERALIKAISSDDEPSSIYSCYKLIQPAHLLKPIDINLLLNSFEEGMTEEQKHAERDGCLPLVPMDVLTHILQFLPAAKYEEVGAVCKRFYRLTRSRMLLPRHLDSNILPDCCLSLNVTTIIELGAILRDTIGNNDERARRMEIFEQNHLAEITTAFRVLRFYHRVLDLRSHCPADKLKLLHIQRFEPYLGTLNQNRFTSQHILAKSSILIEKIGELVNKGDFPILSVKPYLQSCVSILSPLVSNTQTGFSEELAIVPIAFAAVFLPLPLVAPVAPVAPPAVAPDVAPADNNNLADDAQEDGGNNE